MGRHSKAVKLVGGVRGGLALLDDDERRRVIEASERDIDDGVGFFRGAARPDTALMVAYIDEFKDRFRVGPVRRVLAASLDCGFITPRGYRMFRSRPVSRMAARHEALARGILEIHADFFMAVYGYRKTRAQLLARGWDPAEIGRDQVMNVMRELGIRGVRRGRTPVTTKPAEGTGGRPDLVERRFDVFCQIEVVQNSELVKLFVFGVCFINRVPFVRGMRPRVGRGPVSSWSLCAPR